MRPELVAWHLGCSQLTSGYHRDSGARDLVVMGSGSIPDRGFVVIYRLGLGPAEEDNPSSSLSKSGGIPEFNNLAQKNERPSGHIPLLLL